MKCLQWLPTVERILLYGSVDLCERLLRAERVFYVSPDFINEQALHYQYESMMTMTRN